MSAPTAERSGIHVPLRESREDLHLTFIDQSQDAKDAARLAAEAKLTSELNEGGVVRRVLKGIWKGNVAREYYTHKYARQAQAEIEASGNIYVREADETASREAQFATIERFQSEYDEAVHTEAGEKRSEVDQNADFSAAVKDLIRRNVNGELSNDAMLEERTRLLNAWRDEHGAESAGEGKVRIDNMLQIAQAVRGRITHDNSVDDVLEGMKISLGEARSGVRTEVRYNKVEQLVEKFQRTRAGGALSAVVNPEVVMTAATVAASVLRVGSHRAVGAALMTVAPGIASGIWAGARENMRVKEERTQHLREMAQGKQFEVNSKRREEMETTRYETVSANELIESIRGHFNEAGELENFDALRGSIDTLTAVEVRIRESDSRKIDLISYSDAAKVEEERLLLDIARAQAKVATQQYLTPEARDFLGVDADISLQDILQNRATEYIETVESDVSAKDRAFRKLKNRRVAVAAAKGVGYGLAFGLIAQEGGAALSDTRDGLVEGAWDAQNQPFEGEHHQTVLNGLVYGDHGIDQTTVQQAAMTHEASANYATAKFGEHGEIHMSDDHQIVKNENGTINLVDPNGSVTVENLKVNDDGTLSKESLALLKEKGMRVEDLSKEITDIQSITKTVELKDFLENHKDDTARITRDFWYDNDTPSPVYDRNELGLHWGGEGDTGVKEDGTYQFSVNTMTAEGSYHADTSVDWEKVAEDGDIKLAISASKDSQNTPFIIEINKNGNFNIPPNHPAAQFFSMEDGRLQFNGAYAEVIHMVGEDDDGIEHVRPLATFVGEDNVGEVEDLIETKTAVMHPEYKITSAGFTSPEQATTEHLTSFTEMAPVIPIQSRRAMETLFRRRTPEGTPYYGDRYGERYGAGASPERRAEFERSISPRLRDNPQAILNPGQELAWYRDSINQNTSSEYVESIIDAIEGDPLLRDLRPETKAIVTIPVGATSESENIYKTLSIYAQQDPEAIKSSTILLHVNWFDSAENDPTKLARINKTKAEIERARRDFPDLNIATMQSIWEQAKMDRGEYGNGIIGHVARKMYDVAMMTVAESIEQGKHSSDQDVLLIRNDADAQGMDKRYLSHMINAAETQAEKDVWVGGTRWETARHKDLPGFAFVTNFNEVMRITRFRRKTRGGPHTTGINSAVRMSTFAAVGGIGHDPQDTGAGTDDLTVGWRVYGARSGDYAAGAEGGVYGSSAAASITGTTLVADRFGYVVGAGIDSKGDRIEAAYLSDKTITDTWSSFDSKGYSERSSKLGGLKRQESFRRPQELVANIERNMSSMLTNWHRDPAEVSAALAVMLPPKIGNVSTYDIERRPDGTNFKLSRAGAKWLLERLEKDNRGRKDPIGARVRRQLYHEGASRRKRPATPVPRFAK